MLKKIIKKSLILLGIVILGIGVFFYFFPHWFIDFSRSYDRKSIEAFGKVIPFYKEVSGTKSYKEDDLSWSPNKKHVAFTDFVREEIYEKEFFVKVVDARTLKVNTIYIGDYHTSHYEWVDNNILRVYRGGASGATFYVDLDIHIRRPLTTEESFRLEESGLDVFWRIEPWYESDRCALPLLKKYW